MPLQWKTQFEACWFLSCIQDCSRYFLHNDSTKSKKDKSIQLQSSSSQTVTLAYSSSVSDCSCQSLSSDTSSRTRVRMVQRKERKPGVKPTLSTVLDDLPKGVGTHHHHQQQQQRHYYAETCPFDEVWLPCPTYMVRHSQAPSATTVDSVQCRDDSERLVESRDSLPERSVAAEEMSGLLNSSIFRDSIPNTVAFATTTPCSIRNKVLAAADDDDDDDDASDVSCEAFDKDERTLTPHPSFDESRNNQISANDFHYLFEACRELSDHDWPSDEDCLFLHGEDLSLGSPPRPSKIPPKA